MRFYASAFVAVWCCLWSTASSAAERLMLADISDYLNSMTTLKSAFRQINDDGSVSTGQLYIRKPGRMRFEYDPPEQALVIVAASAIVIIDKKSNQPSETYPLNRTPLALVLRPNIDLKRSNMVREARFDGVSTVVTAFDSKDPDAGYIEMTFTDNPTLLREWVIHEASGSKTRVILGPPETGMHLPESLFDADREKGRRR